MMSSFLGVGKTVIVNEIFHRFNQKGVRCAKTASTGLAARHIDGTTIHRLTGIGDGRFTANEYAEWVLQTPAKLEQLR